MFVTNWISTTKIQKISEITNFFRHYFLSRTEVGYVVETVSIFGRTTPVVHAVVNCYTPTIIQTYDTPSYRKWIMQHPQCQ